MPMLAASGFQEAGLNKFVNQIVTSLQQTRVQHTLWPQIHAPSRGGEPQQRVQPPWHASMTMDGDTD